MSVITNAIGPNSRQIVISGETSTANIITAIDTSLTELGWTAWDTTTTGARNCLVTKVYRAVNADHPTNPTYKYLILRFDAPRQKYYVSCAENWNPSTHAALNESFYGGRYFPAGIQYDHCSIYVFASERYAAFMTVVRNDHGPWMGVFEFERTAPEDTVEAGVPCFGWTSSLTIGAPFGSASSSTATAWGSSPFVMSVPRTCDGATGASAAASFIVETSIGAMPPPRYVVPHYGVGGITRAQNAHNGHLGTFGTGTTYAWDSMKTLASNIGLAGADKVYPVGRIYGLKVIPNSGSILDTIVMPVDAAGFMDSTGTNTQHCVLGLNGGYADTIGAGTNRMLVTQYTGASNGAAPRQILVVGGKWLLVATSTGVRATNLFTANTVVVTTVETTDLVFDGEKYVYASTASGVTRIDVRDWTTESLAVTGGSGCLAIDDTFLYAAQRTVNATPKMDIIDLATFTIARTFVSATAISPAARFNALWMADYDGYVYAVTISSNSAASCRFWRVFGADGGSTSVAPIGATSMGIGAYLYTGDGKFRFTFYVTPGAGYYAGEITADALMTYTAFSTGAPFVYQNGDFNAHLPMFKGYGVQRSLNTGNVFYLFMVGFAHNSNGTVSPGYFAGAITTCTLGQYAGMAIYTDGCALFTCENTVGYKASNCYGTYNSNGNPAANILLPF